MSGRAALMVYGGWEGHEPEASVRRFVPFLEGEGFTVTLSDSLAILDHGHPERVAGSQPPRHH